LALEAGGFELMIDIRLIARFVRSAAKSKQRTSSCCRTEVGDRQ
jgi:hypothetical protein